MGKTTTSPPNSTFADKLHAGIDAGSAALEAAKDAYSNATQTGGKQCLKKYRKKSGKSGKRGKSRKSRSRRRIRRKSKSKRRRRSKQKK